MDTEHRYQNIDALLENTKIDQILTAAKEEFFRFGIQQAKFKNIAKRAHISEASVYRYILDKNDLATLVAYAYWKEQGHYFQETYETIVKPSKTGLLKIQRLLEIFLDLYQHHVPFLKFMEDFDVYSMGNELLQKNMTHLSHVDQIRKMFIHAFHEGQEDGSIRKDLTPEKLYSFVSQGMVSTTQKVSIRVGSVHQGDESYSLGVLQLMITMFLHYIKTKDE